MKNSPNQPHSLRLRQAPLLLAASLLAFLPAAFAQDGESTAPEQEVRSILSDPRLQNALRSAGRAQDQLPDSAADQAQKAADEAMREFGKATRTGGELSEFDTPENRAKAEALALEAKRRAEEAAARPENAEAVAAAREKGEALLRGVSEAAAAEEEPSGESEPVAMAEESLEAEPEAEAPSAAEIKPPATRVPATRPANTAVDFVTPIAKPTEEMPSRIASEPTPDTAVATATLPPLPGASPTVPRIPDHPLLAAAEAPEPQPLRRRYFPGEARTERTEADGQNMIITSREVVMDKGLLTFTGNVYVNSPDFDLRCEILEIHTAGGNAPGASSEGGQSFEKVVASGGMVEIKRHTVDDKGRPKVQIAMARRAEFDNATRDMILSGGPPYIQDGDSFVETNSPDAKIIMRGNGRYEVTGSDAGPKGRMRIVVPVDGPDKTQEMGIGGGLGGGLDRLR